jgi:hypothetical protein
MQKAGTGGDLYDAETECSEKRRGHQKMLVFLSGSTREAVANSSQTLRESLMNLPGIPAFPRGLKPASIVQLLCTG